MQKPASGIHPRQIKHMRLYQKPLYVDHKRRKLGAGVVAGAVKQKEGERRKVSEDLRPSLSLHKFQFLF